MTSILTVRKPLNKAELFSSKKRLKLTDIVLASPPDKLSPNKDGFGDLNDGDSLKGELDVIWV
jgi:hypothetical protein